jgi:hypothetical protein
MVAMGIFPFKEKYPWQNRESNLGPHYQLSETLATRPRGWSKFIFDINTNLLFVQLRAFPLRRACLQMIVA